MNTPAILLRTAAMGIAATVALATSSCTEYQAQGAGLGALGGAAVGAIVGDDSSDVVAGAAIGAAAGAGAAALHEQGQYNTAGNQPPPPPKPRKTSNYPLATPHPTDSNLVISPYRPHNVIDVKGFRTGQLARDPSTAPLDPATGKPNMAEAKIFELP